MELKLYEGTREQCERKARAIRREESKLRQLGGKGNYSSVSTRLVFESGVFDGPTNKTYAVFAVCTYALAVSNG